MGKNTASILLILAGAAVVLFASADAARDQSTPGPAGPPGPAASAAVAGAIPEVRVEGGTVSGVLEGDVAVYKGIPYAAAPVGALRWRPPAPVAAWSGVRRADDFGASCFQAAPPQAVPPDSRAATMSEDCLNLNVWTRAGGADKRPVMVWLHGGANASGTASLRYYDGRAFARDGVVLVSLNYRVGLLGFFAHRAILEEAHGAATANFGLLDQIAALRWVRANVAAFGGDPSNVTVFGESAGGEDAVTLAASPAASGLFRRVIAESAADLWNRWPTLEQARSRSATVATVLGLHGDAASVEQLRALAPAALAKVPFEDLVGPLVDGHIVTAEPATALAGGTRVPLVIGTNDDDGSVLGDFNDVALLFPDVSTPDLKLARDRYAARGITGSAIVRPLFTATHFAVPARWIAARTAAAGTPAYLYRFDYVASFLAAKRPAATHGSEIPFVFGSFPAQWLAAADGRVQSALHDCWVAFARSGEPRCSAGPWPAYDPRDRRIMVFDAQPSVREPGDTDLLDALERDFVNH